ncbi:MAG: cobalamin-dependent protein [Methanobacterium sp.]|uniref:cobalamin B12-binding domain-containing protein n=1 Tax=Methanobacterium sp. TaxID=2164 RepID=UPI003C795A6A
MNEFEIESGVYFDLASLYLDSLLMVQSKTASKIIINAVEQGVAIKDIYIYVFEPCQHEIGRLWQTNQITMYQEHFCTAATQNIMTQLYPHIFQSEKNGHKLVATCVNGEIHEMGIRMVSDLFEIEGWDTYYLGADIPTESILKTLEQIKPDILAISISMAFNIRSVVELINKIKENPEYSDMKIMVGGRPFIISPYLWKKVGADGSATNAVEAITLANKLILENTTSEEFHVK